MRAPEDVPSLAGVREHGVFLPMDRACFTRGGDGLRVEARPKAALNRDTALQSSFNIHLWVAFAPTRGENQWALLFGPSFGVGKFSLNL